MNSVYVATCEICHYEGLRIIEENFESEEYTDYHSARYAMEQFASKIISEYGAIEYIRDCHLMFLV